MTATMDLDALKQAWKSLDAQLSLHNRLALDSLRERKVRSMRARLRPLLIGQCVQMLFGAWLVLIGVHVWTAHREVWHLLLSGIAIHVFGLATVVCGGLVCGGIARIDGTLPVVELQRRLAWLRRAYIVSGMCVGLPWWVMWVPFIITLAMSATGSDIVAAAMASDGAVNWLSISVTVGVLGLMATWAFHRWSRHPRRAALGQRLDNAAAGRSLQRAQAELEALRAYMHDPDAADD